MRQCGLLADNPTLRTVPVAGLDIAVWEWPGDGPALFFAHATGFHGRCWDRIAQHFPGRRRLAIDFRGHGRSGKPAPPIPWDGFGHDLTAVAVALDVRGAIGIGHSMGGHSVVAAALLRPQTFSALVLVDPTIFPPEYYGTSSLDASFVLRRRNRWTSPLEMIERFRDRPPFATWQPEILRDYCEYGLLPDGDAYVLACPPAVEASIYEHSSAPGSNLHAGIPTLHHPVTVMRAAALAKPGTLDLNASQTAPGLASEFPNGRDVYLPGRNHYIPMEWPEGVVAEIVGQALPPVHP